MVMENSGRLSGLAKLLIRTGVCLAAGVAVHFTFHGYILAHPLVRVFHFYIWYIAWLATVAVSIWHERLYVSSVKGSGYYRLILVVFVIGIAYMTYGTYCLLADPQAILNAR